jgi:hypothetical protein
MKMFTHIHMKAMPSTETIGSWNYRKGRLQQRFPQLTDQDLMLDAYNRDQMFENLLTKLGKTDKELHDIIIAL